MTQTTSSFTKLGAKMIEKLLTSKYGCTIITSAQFDEARGMWLSTYHDPSLEKYNESKIAKSKPKRTTSNNKKLERKRRKAKK